MVNPMTARAILGLINPNLKTTGEVILNEDIDLLKASKEELRKNKRTKNMYDITRCNVSL